MQTIVSAGKPESETPDGGSNAEAGGADDTEAAP